MSLNIKPTVPYWACQRECMIPKYSEGEEVACAFNTQGHMVCIHELVCFKCVKSQSSTSVFISPQLKPCEFQVQLLNRTARQPGLGQPMCCKSATLCDRTPSIVALSLYRSTACCQPKMIHGQVHDDYFSPHSRLSLSPPHFLSPPEALLPPAAITYLAMWSCFLATTDWMNPSFAASRG